MLRWAVQLQFTVLAGTILKLWCLEQYHVVKVFEVLASLCICYFVGWLLSLVINRPNCLPEVFKINQSLFSNLKSIVKILQ